MIPTNGTHSPFDSDACAEWAIYCYKNNHDPNRPLTSEEYEEYKKEFTQTTPSGSNTVQNTEE